MISAVIFDLDGTLTRTPSPWQHIHQRFGLWEDTACLYLNEWQSGGITYEEFCRRDARLWAGRSLKEIEALLDEIHINRHVPAIVQNLVDRRIPSIIISSGFRYIAARIQQTCRREPLIIHANELLEGPEVRINVSGDFFGPLSKKALAARTLQSVGSTWSQTLVVSDSTRDLDQLCECQYQLLVEEEDDLLQVQDFWQAAMSDDSKQLAAAEAVNEVRNGMVVGLGTGSTASHFIRELGERVRLGLRITAIPTSEASRRLAQDAGIALTTFKEAPVIDLTVDGADEVSPDLDLIKGLGGALVREKVVAHASKRVVIIVDEAKLVDRLGSRTGIPIEVIPFSADLVAMRLEHWGGQAVIRLKNGQPFVSDNGNTVIDWAHGTIENPAELEKRIKAIIGVVDSGIFAGVAGTVISAGPTGIRRLERPGRRE